jgi:hypothetical protein
VKVRDPLAKLFCELFPALGGDLGLALDYFASPLLFDFGALPATDRHHLPLAGGDNLSHGGQPVGRPREPGAGMGDPARDSLGVGGKDGGDGTDVDVTVLGFAAAEGPDQQSGAVSGDRRGAGGVDWAEGR